CSSLSNSTSRQTVPAEETTGAAPPLPASTTPSRRSAGGCSSRSQTSAAGSGRRTSVHGKCTSSTSSSGRRSRDPFAIWCMLPCRSMAPSRHMARPLPLARRRVALALPLAPQAPALLLFSAANWALWGDAYGKLAAARQGVAGKVRDWAETLIVVDERYEEGAGHRVLGRLHAEAPHVPFVTGWVDHDKSVTE